MGDDVQGGDADAPAQMGRDLRQRLAIAGEGHRLDIHGDTCRQDIDSLNRRVEEYDLPGVDPVSGIASHGPIPSFLSMRPAWMPDILSDIA